MTTVSVETARDSPAAIDAPAARARVRAGLVWTLIRTDFKTRYHGSVGGFVWALLKPFAMFVVLMSVFSLLFATRADYKLELIIGLFLWDFFAEGTKAGLTSLASKSYLLTKARFPSWVVVVTSIANAAITLVVFGLIITIYLAVAGRAPSPLAFVCFLGYCVALVAFVVGFALATSVLFLRYRDLNQVWDVATQAGFFVAPIVYPLGIIPERFHIYLYLWPPTPVIQFARAALVSGALPTLRGDFCLLLDAGVCLAVGALAFGRLAPKAAEYV